MSESVSVRIPASTSNCGPGFDTLGIALNLYGSVTLQLGEGGVAYVGDDPNFPAMATGMVQEAVELFCRECGIEASGYGYSIDSKVPIARGLGSSVILRGGILAGLNAIHQAGLDRNDLVRLVGSLEGHPDNASASILGGFTVTRFCPETKNYLGTQKFAVDYVVHFVVVAPNLEIKTDDSRSLLPQEIEFTKVVSSLNSLSYLVGAFASGNYEDLQHCRVDHLHEAYRLKNIPQAQASIQAGLVAGAYTGWLSGSGSSVLCVCDSSTTDRVKSAMELAFNAAGIAFDSFVLQADNQGMVVKD